MEDSKIFKKGHKTATKRQMTDKKNKEAERQRDRETSKETHTEIKKRGKMIYI